MEPLTIFFVLEGLFFTGIGTHYIIRGILNRNSTTGERLSSMRVELKELRDESFQLFELYKDLIEARKSKQSQFVIEQRKVEIEEFEEKSITDRLMLLEVCAIHSHNIFQEFIEEKNTDKNQSYIGFPFIIGGIFLQGIGVIVQLF